MKPGPYALAIGAGVVVLAVGAWWVARRGVAGAAADVGGAAIDAVGGVATGAVTGVSVAVGIPTPAQTTTDDRVARWLIDHYGYFTASQWSGAAALVRAALLPANSGTPPAAGSPVAVALGTEEKRQADAETMRLLGRYPAPSAPAWGDTGGASYEPMPGYAWGA